MRRGVTGNTTYLGNEGHAVRWIVIYPVNSVIHLLNSPALNNTWQPFKIFYSSKTTVHSYYAPFLYIAMFSFSKDRTIFSIK